jgi:hypothetical protein
LIGIFISYWQEDSRIWKINQVILGYTNNSYGDPVQSWLPWTFRSSQVPICFFICLVTGKFIFPCRDKRLGGEMLGCLDPAMVEYFLTLSQKFPLKQAAV